MFVGLAVRLLGQLVAHLLLRPPLGFTPAEEPEHDLDVAPPSSPLIHIFKTIHLGLLLPPFKFGTNYYSKNIRGCAQYLTRGLSSSRLKLEGKGTLEITKIHTLQLDGTRQSLSLPVNVSVLVL